MKKLFCILLTFLLVISLWAQETENESVLNEEVENTIEAEKTLEVENTIESENTLEASEPGMAEVPPAKRPKPIDSEKAKKAAEKDDSEEDVEKFRNTIQYGIPSEISELLDNLIKNDDPRFSEEIYDVFQISKNPTIKEKIITYFTNLEDPCLEDFAVDLLNDPYDEKKEVVKACFTYIAKVKTTAAIPAVITLIESENEQYFNDAISTLGDIGGPKEALFLVEYLDREDLSDAQRQTLMRTCGKMHAVQTWDKIVEILDNEDENAFVKMYACEAIGLMQVNKSIPVLISQFNEADPNLRQYVIKGLVNFPNDNDACQTIIQGIRDEHWKVRLESIKAVSEMNMTDSVPYLIYRAKNDSEKVIKDESYNALAKLHTKESCNFLLEQLKDKKVGDATKKKIVEVSLKEGNSGDTSVLEIVELEIMSLAETCVNDDKRKDLRYAIGKELAKYGKPSYEHICSLYLASKDSTTQSLGVDIYKIGRYASVEERLHELYEDKKTNANLKKRIAKILKIEETEEDK